MVCEVTTTNMNIEAATVKWGREDQVCITPVAGLSGGEHFKLSNQEIKYVFYITVNSVGADPAIAGYTSVEVAVPTAYTVADFNASFKIAVEAFDFIADISSDLLSVKTTTLDIGSVLEAVVDIDSTFTFDQIVTGLGGDLGRTKSAIEVAFEFSELDVLANQTGETILDKIITGNNASLSLELLEMTSAKWELIMAEGYGDKKVVVGDTLVGVGTSKINQSTFGFAGKLILHPVRLPEADRSRDFIFPKTVAKPTTINFDGTDTQAMGVDFSALPDFTKSSAINLCSFGDWKKDLR